jgi:hypothetical protein
MEKSKNRYLAVRVFSIIFIISIVITLLSWSLLYLPTKQSFPTPTPTPTPNANIGGQAGDTGRETNPLLIWLPVFTAAISAIGTFSAILIAWRSDRRDAREKGLKIAQLERELEEAKKKKKASKPKKAR